MSSSPRERLIHPSGDILEDPILPHSVYNRGGEMTIVFIHGAFQSRREWNLVIEHLPAKYQLLIPDLPGHGESRFITPFSVKYAATLIARLISKNTLNGRAYVVGLSLGAHVAIELATSYPDAAEEVFVSGYEIYDHNLLSPYVPYILWVMQRCENLVPRRVIRWLMDGADLERVDPFICTLPLCQQIVSPMTEVKWPSPWRARTLIVAAGKGGLIPSSDHPEDAKKLMQIAGELDTGTVAVTHPRMRHPWNRQDPELFAQTILAWFERRDLPSGFQYL